MADLVVMRRIDQPHLNHPFAGSRVQQDLLVDEGIAAGRRHVETSNLASHARKRIVDRGPD